MDRENPAAKQLSEVPNAPRWNVPEHLSQIGFVLKWLALGLPLAAAVGSAVALFLWLLDEATQTRHAHPWLLYLLPLAGVAIALSYQWAGKAVEKGNNFIIDEIHQPGGGVPLRMTPLVLAGTVITHLFGGSAGREGTAVQMGGSIASKCAGWLRLAPGDARLLMMTGVAAGFGAVFGTPITGAIFAMEVLVIGRIRHEAVIPCLIGAIAADWTCSAWGIHHTHYHIASALVPELAAGAGRFSLLLAAKVAMAAVAFGLAATLFSEMAHGLQGLFKKIRWAWLRPVVGALVVIGLVHLLGTRDYLGLGVNPPPGGRVSILSAFEAGGSNGLSWFWKIVFTAVTLSSGFKGGEVTPLFFIGATLGNTLAGWLGAPVDLFAGLGFIAVFAGATNTPLACTIMGVELFGAQYTVYFAIACFTAYLFSGHTGIYLSQVMETTKLGAALEGGGEVATLRGARVKRWARGAWPRAK